MEKQMKAVLSDVMTCLRRGISEYETRDKVAVLKDLRLRVETMLFELQFPGENATVSITYD